MRTTVQMARFYSVTKYGADDSLWISKLLEALDSFPHNAYGWAVLGAYLGLNHRPESAARASERAAEEFSHSVGEGALIARWRDASHLNQARFELRLNRPRASLEALRRIERPDALSPVLRLDYYWLAARAHADVGQARTAAEMLAKASETDDRFNDLLKSSPVVAASLRWDFPRYFGLQARQAGHSYMAGLVAASAGEWARADEHFREATSFDEGLLDVRYSHALASSPR